MVVLSFFYISQSEYQKTASTFVFYRVFRPFPNRLLKRGSARPPVKFGESGANVGLDVGRGKTGRGRVGPHRIK